MTARLRHLGMWIMGGWVLFGSLSCTPAARYNRSLESVMVVAYHRMHPAFAETTQVAPGRMFLIGDGEYAGRVVQFFPDFIIDEDGRAASRSTRPDNAAVKLEVHHHSQRVGFAWAFAGTDLPHFRRDELLAFRIIRVSIRDAPDSHHEATP